MIKLVHPNQNICTFTYEALQFTNPLLHKNVKRKIYYISGLGADERVFKFLKIDNAEEIFIKWVCPKENENLCQYSKRLINQIDTTQKVILIGVSFGGIILQEIAKHIATEKLIIISSVKGFNEYGLALKLVSYTKIHKLFPASILKWSNLMTADFYFGIKSKEASKLLKTIIKETDPQFMIWAINEIMNWREKTSQKNDIIHIQGDCDRIFTNRNIDNAQWIKNGGHFMIVNKAQVLSRIINRAIA